MPLDRKSEEKAPHAGNGLFPLTQWTRIRRAGHTDEKLSAAAASEICRIYWYPTFVTARVKHQAAHHEAEDLAQGFWAWVLENDILARATPERGRFRTFLLTCFDRFIYRESRKKSAVKRGGGAPHISIDGEDWNGRFEREMGAAASPDELVDRVWEDAGLEAAFGEVEGAWVERGRGKVFHALKEHLVNGSEHGALGAIAAELGISEANTRQMLFRLRRELRDAGKRWLGGKGD